MGLYNLWWQGLELAIGGTYRLTDVEDEKVGRLWLFEGFPSNWHDRRFLVFCFNNSTNAVNIKKIQKIECLPWGTFWSYSNSFSVKIGFLRNMYSLQKGHKQLVHERVQCGECGKEIANKFDLKVHKKRVHGINPENSYKCQKCPKFFSLQTNLDKHIASKHESYKEWWKIQKHYHVIYV